MLVMLYGFMGLFLLRLIRRHGWEYVPLVLFAVGAAIYKGGAFAEIVLLTTTAGVYMVSRKEVRTQAAMPADW